ncbi:MAG: proline--tRNA ligase [Bacilli bacterium]|jgi:prolyl-tRNA synthetase|nr:proline--tRNA ligase [Bacilli bacterium]
MENKKIKNESITRQETDFAQWYTDVCLKAELMDYSSVKGFIIYRPYGYAIWELIQSYLDRRFKETGHENCYMPLVIPTTLFNKEKEHVEGFAPETLICTIGGKNKLDDPLIIRPTSETLFCEHYAKIISSYRDLPKKYNQWCSVVRWEKTTRPFLRGSEFLWQEGHTMHESEVEARTETLAMLEIYDDLGKDLLAIPFVKGQKTNKEKFAGAEETYSIEALMPDGKALQSGTTHYFGQGFSKAFNVAYQSKEGKLEHPYQTSWGVSTRLLGSVIMAHGDDNGLVLPPFLAPIQVVVVPIAQQKPGVIPAAREIYDILKRAGLRVKLDESDKTPGYKFAEWEMKGVPLRLEIGPRDIENEEVVLSKRNTGEKIVVKTISLVETIEKLLNLIHKEMYEKSHRYLLNHIQEVRDFDELNAALDKGGYAKVMWCGDEGCETKIKELTTATARCMPFNQEPFDDKCLVCGKKATKVVLFAKAY